jgi:hypothetical protein
MITQNPVRNLSTLAQYTQLIKQIWDDCSTLSKSERGQLLREFVMGAAVADARELIQPDWDKEGCLLANKDTKVWWVIQKLSGMTSVTKQNPAPEEDRSQRAEAIDISSDSSSSSSLSSSSSSSSSSSDSDKTKEEDTEQPAIKKRKSEEDSVMDVEETPMDAEDNLEKVDTIMEDVEQETNNHNNKNGICRTSNKQQQQQQQKQKQKRG